MPNKHLRIDYFLTAYVDKPNMNVLFIMTGYLSRSFFRGDFFSCLVALLYGPSRWEGMGCHVSQQTSMDKKWDDTGI